MKLYGFILLFALYTAECRKVVPPINKHANIDFINMESGGLRAPNKAPSSPNSAPAPVKPISPTPAKPAAVTQPTNPQPANPPPPKPVVQPTIKPVPTNAATLITPRPVGPTPATKPIVTPGPGSVKQLVTFYDSQGKASPIRSYSYSQAVKQG